MVTFLENIPNWQQPNVATLRVPREMSRLNEDIEGQLYISHRGYVYTPISKPVAWLKFLGIGIGLPFVALAAKVKELGQRLSRTFVPHKGYHEFNHVGKLLSIAWKAVVGAGGYSIQEDVEKFALAEIDYNNPNRMNEMQKVRSARLTQGVYFAKCMQPLFQKAQFESPLTIATKLREAEAKKASLQSSRQAKIQNQQNRDYLTSLIYAVTYYVDQYGDHSIAEIDQEIVAVDTEIARLNRVMESAHKCEKYAMYSIMAQQSVCAGATETVEEVRCCNITCYRHQRICGLVHKVDVCATRCWAIDCLCCMLCIWPDGGNACLL